MIVNGRNLQAVCIEEPPMPVSTATATANGDDRIALQRDPFCGMTADPASAGHSSGHKGTEYYFCLTRCPERFERAPNDFLEPRRPREPVTKGTRNTSPVHPDIMRDGPEDCPICSMALETMDIPSADAAPNPELIEFTRRIWIGAALSAPVVALAMAPHVGLGLHDWFGERPATWLELLLATPAVLWCGWPFSQRG